MKRRPPSGVGPLFAADDEAGEEFSSCYLNDLKEGRCTTQSTATSRISELARRNSMQPAHLKSSYPAETQFHDKSDFTDDDLKQSRISLAPSDLRALRRESSVSNIVADRRQSTLSSSSYPLRRQTLSNVTTSSACNVVAGTAKTSSTDLKRKPDAESHVSSKRLRKDVENISNVEVSPVVAARRSERKMNQTFTTPDPESPSIVS